MEACADFWHACYSSLGSNPLTLTVKSCLRSPSSILPEVPSQRQSASCATKAEKKEHRFRETSNVNEHSEINEGNLK